MSLRSIASRANSGWVSALTTSVQTYSAQARGIDLIVKHVSTSTNAYVWFLTRSFSDQQLLEALLGAEATESHVAPATVIEPQLAEKPALPFL